MYELPIRCHCAKCGTDLNIINDFKIHSPFFINLRIEECPYCQLCEEVFNELSIEDIVNHCIDIPTEVAYKKKNNELRTLKGHFLETLEHDWKDRGLIYFYDSEDDQIKSLLTKGLQNVLFIGKVFKIPQIDPL